MSLNVETTGAMARQVLPRRLVLGRIAAAWTDVFVVVTTVIAALVRLPTLAAKGFWYDELISVSIAQESIGTILRARLSIGASQELIDRLYTNNPPVHLLLIHATLQISPNEAVVRYPFALAGIATVPVMYLVVARLFSHTLAVLSAALLAISPIHIAYSQEARPAVLLVLLSLLALYFLLRALDGEGTGNWVAFAACAALACWTNYFALTLVMPTLGVVALITLAGGLRHPWPKAGFRAFLAPGIAYGAVALTILPLLPDLLMTADRNRVAASDSLENMLSAIPISLVGVVGLTSPVPGSIWASVPILMLTFLGVWALVRRPDRRTAIWAAWLVTPIAIWIVISSSHFFSVRYILWMLPLMLVLPFIGLSSLEQVLQQTFSTRVVRLVSFTSVGLLFFTFATGIRAYEDEYISSGPVKRDWRGLVETYRAEATTNSCLIVVDDVGIAIYREVPYYLNRDDRSLCVIDVRDPRLEKVVSTYDDLWWGVAVPQDDRTRLANAFAGTAKVEISTLVVLIRDVTATGATPELRAETTLQAMLAALVPLPGRFDSSLGVRGGLANLYLLSGESPTRAADLLHGIKTTWGDSDVQQWANARRSLERGDLEKARILGIRLVALYPSDPDAYDLLAEIEDRVGGTTGPVYRALADALRI